MRRCPNDPAHLRFLAPASTTVMVDGEGNYLHDIADQDLDPKVDHESEWWYCADCGVQAIGPDENPEDATEGLCDPIMLTDADPTEE